MPTVGVYDASPEAYLPLVREAVPESRLRICREPDATGALEDVDVLLAFKFPSRPFPREQILGLPRLRWVQLASAGPDHILPFDGSRVTVTSASGIHGDAIAEYVLGLLVHARWDVPRLMRHQAARRWERYEVPLLRGLTMGVAGAGHVGGEVAARARAFGMRTLGVARSPGPRPHFDRVAGLERLLDVMAASDVLVVSLPLTAETRGVIDRAALAALKPGAWFVNVSRGGVVQELPLIDAIRSGHLRGAILDVFADEPLPAGSPFWDLPGVIVTPHIASEFAGWQVAVGQLFCDNLQRYRRGAPLVNVVDSGRGY